MEYTAEDLAREKKEEVIRETMDGMRLGKEQKMTYQIDTISTDIREYKVTLPTVADRNEWLAEARHMLREDNDVYETCEGLKVTYADQTWDDSKAFFIVCTKTALKRLVDTMTA